MILDAFASLRSIAAPAARWAGAHRAFAELGVEWMTLASAPAASLMSISLRSSAPPRLLDDYVGAGLPLRDKWLQHSAASTEVDAVNLAIGRSDAEGVLSPDLAEILRDHSAKHVALAPLGDGARVAALVVYALTTDGSKRLAHAAAGPELPLLAAIVSLLCPVHGEGVPEDGMHRWGNVLSPRERETLTWLASGLRTTQIAHRMGIREVTVGLHLQGARRKLGARTREQALAIALRDGHIAP